MNYMDVPAGRYDAKAVRARSAVSTQKQTPYFEVEFNIPEVDANLRWQGYYTDKTKKRTLDVMALLEWNGDTDFAEGAISTDKEVSIVVTREMGQDGKERPRVQWVNPVGGGAQFEGLQPQEAKSVFANIKAEMAEARQRAGVEHKSTARPKNYAPGADDEDSIPF